MQATKSTSQAGERTQFKAFNAITGEFWNGSSFSGSDISKSPSLTRAQLNGLKMIWLNVSEWQSKGKPTTKTQKRIIARAKTYDGVTLLSGILENAAGLELELMGIGRIVRLPRVAEFHLFK